MRYCGENGHVNGPYYVTVCFWCFYIDITTRRAVIGTVCPHSGRSEIAPRARTSSKTAAARWSRGYSHSSISCVTFSSSRSSPSSTIIMASITRADPRSMDKPADRMACRFHSAVLSPNLQSSIMANAPKMMWPLLLPLLVIDMRLNTVRAWMTTTTTTDTVVSHHHVAGTITRLSRPTTQLPAQSTPDDELDDAAPFSRRDFCIAGLTSATTTAVCVGAPALTFAEEETAVPASPPALPPTTSSMTTQTDPADENASSSSSSSELAVEETTTAPTPSSSDASAKTTTTTTSEDPASNEHPTEHEAPNGATTTAEGQTKERSDAVTVKDDESSQTGDSMPASGTKRTETNTATESRKDGTTNSENAKPDALNKEQSRKEYEKAEAVKDEPKPPEDPKEESDPAEEPAKKDEQPIKSESPKDDTKKDEFKEQVNDFIDELEKDEKDEIKTEKETEDLAAKLEQQRQNEQKSTTQEQEKETQKMMDQIEKDEVRNEQETAELINKLEKLQDSAAKSKTDLLAEPNAKTPKAAAKASAKETNDFLSQLKKRLKADDDYVSMLEYQKNRYGAGEEDFFTKLKNTELYKEEEEFFEKVKERIEANREFKALYHDFLGRLRSGQ